MKLDPWAGIWFVFFNILDCATTLWGVQIGKLREGNPVMAPLVYGSPWIFVIIKFAYPYLVAKYVRPETVRWGAFFMAMVVTWNVTLLLRG